MIAALLGVQFKSKPNQSKIKIDSDQRFGDSKPNQKYESIPIPKN